VINRLSGRQNGTSSVSAVFFIIRELSTQSCVSSHLRAWLSGVSVHSQRCVIVIGTIMRKLGIHEQSEITSPPSTPLLISFLPHSPSLDRFHGSVDTPVFALFVFLIRDSLERIPQQMIKHELGRTRWPSLWENGASCAPMRCTQPEGT
jgi:hypothetical protein